MCIMSLIALKHIIFLTKVVSYFSAVTSDEEDGTSNHDRGQFNVHGALEDYKVKQLEYI